MQSCASAGCMRLRAVACRLAGQAANRQKNKKSWTTERASSFRDLSASSQRKVTMTTGRRSQLKPLRCGFCLDVSDRVGRWQMADGEAV